MAAPGITKSTVPSGQDGEQRGDHCSGYHPVAPAVPAPAAPPLSFGRRRGLEASSPSPPAPHSPVRRIQRSLASPQAAVAAVAIVRQRVLTRLQLDHLTKLNRVAIHIHGDQPYDWRPAVRSTRTKPPPDHLPQNRPNFGGFREAVITLMPPGGTYGRRGAPRASWLAASSSGVG